MLEELELLDLVGKMITGPAVSHFHWTVAEVTAGVTARRLHAAIQGRLGEVRC